MSFKSFFENFGFILPLIVVIASFVEIYNKKKKKEEKISKDLKVQKAEKNKKSIINSFLDEMNNAYNDNKKEEYVNETLYSSKNKENIEEEGLKEELKNNDYSFISNTDDMIEKIKRERQELREKYISFEPKETVENDFEVDIDSEIDTYDLANAFILKEILDKPVALRD